MKTQFSMMYIFELKLVRHDPTGDFKNKYATRSKKLWHLVFVFKRGYL